MNAPRRIRLEASNMCQLKCPLCDTPKRKDDPGVLGWGYMPYERFRELMDKNPSVKEVELSWKGEIFFNPDLGRIIRFAHDKGIELHARGGVNMNYVAPGVLKDMVKYGFRSLYVAIDGASQATYGTYRKNGHIRKVIGNVMKINRFKKKYGSEFPKLTWQFIVFGHNEHEIEKAMELAKRLDMDFYTKSSWDASYSPVKDWRRIKKAVGKDFVSREIYAALNGKDYNDKVCQDLWDEPVISWNGDVFGCCQNASKSLGNVFTDGLDAVLNSDGYTYMQGMVTGKNPPREDIVCSKCPVYKKKKITV